MKKVCILTSVHSAFDVRIFHKEAKTLVNAGFDVTLIAQRDNKQLVTDNRQLATIVDGVKVIFLSKLKNRFFRMLFLTREVYKLALKQRADIYHFHDPELLPWVVKLKKKTAAKIIYDVHEDIPKQILSKYWVPKFLRKPISIIFNFFEKKISRKLDFIITVGDNVKDEFKKVNLNANTIKNFPILENFKEIIKEKREKESSIFNIIYAGGITEIRGITQIVKAMEYLSDNVKLKLLGDFSPKSYTATVKNLKGFRSVDYLGKVDFKKVSYYYNLSDMGIICFLPEPNHIESVPNKFFEYMAAGLPIVASNFPLWKKIVEGNNCGICVDPLKPKEIAKAIKYLKDNPKKAREMGENGRKAVLEKYNWENEAKKLLSIYEKLAKKQK